jgi:predicted transcriptional regulator of viral defense system
MVHPALRARAERRFGLFTTAEARLAGYEASEIRSLCGTGRWIRLRRGVLIVASDLAAVEQQGRRHDAECLAVLLSLGRRTAVISHGSAARLWDLPVPRSLEPTIRLTDTEQWRRGQGWRMACAPLEPSERWRTGPVRLTSAARTLVDCAREWALTDAVIAMDAAILAERTTPDDLRRAAAAMRHWPGAPRTVRAAALADGRAESPLETRARLRILGAGLPTPELQVEIRAGGRLVGVVDAWFEEAAVAVECDGRVKYTDPWRNRTPREVLWEEKRREDELRALDIRVVRLADADIEPARWPPVEERLRRLVATAGPPLRRFTAVPRLRGIERTARSAPTSLSVRRPHAGT